MCGRSNNIVNECQQALCNKDAISPIFYCNDAHENKYNVVTLARFVKSFL